MDQRHGVALEVSSSIVASQAGSLGSACGREGEGNMRRGAGAKIQRPSHDECVRFVEAEFGFGPFPGAEEVWIKRDFATLIRCLEHTEQPLSPMWQDRYEFALKNAKGGRC
jgi:hypothetical protein